MTNYLYELRFEVQSSDGLHLLMLSHIGRFIFIILTLFVSSLSV